MHRLIQAARPLVVAVALCTALASARADDCPDLAVGELGTGLIEHSCFHTTNGPFATVAATPGTTATAATANLDPVHTHHAVAIDPAQANVVTYMPVRTGHWAIFGDNDVPHAVFDAAGQEVPVERVHAVAACPAIPIVRVYALAALTRYTLRLGPSTAAATTTPVVIEKVSDFEAQHGRDADGDGFGGAGDVVTTACVPPAGYVPNLADCDDTEPRIHPGAAERCDGIDDNCNGLADEGVCSVGGGGCASVPSRHGEPSALAIAAGLALLVMTRRWRWPR